MSNRITNEQIDGVIDDDAEAEPEPKAEMNLSWRTLMPMLIVAILNGDKKGCAETILLDLATWLDAKGVKV